MVEEEVKYETEKLRRFPPKLKTLKEFNTTEFITFNTDKHTILEAKGNAKHYLLNMVLTSDYDPPSDANWHPTPEDSWQSQMQWVMRCSLPPLAIQKLWALWSH